MYANVLAQTFGSLDAVTMANCLPWGSRTTREFIDTLGERNPALLKRALGFADELNAEIVAVLNPKLMLVPFSFGRDSQIDRVYGLGVAMSRATDLREHQVGTQEGPTFRFYVGTCCRGRIAVPTVYLPHPASLRPRKEDTRRLVSALARALSRYL